MSGLVQPEYAKSLIEASRDPLALALAVVDGLYTPAEGEAILARWEANPTAMERLAAMPATTGKTIAIPVTR